MRQSLESNKPVDNEDALDILAKICSTWDYADRLAPLDVFRCAATSPLLASSSRVGSPIQVATAAAIDGFPQGGQPNENTVMMALRTIVNLFSTSEGRKLIANPEEATRSINLVRKTLGLDGSNAIGKNSRNLLIAVGTVSINYAVLASKGVGLPNDCSVQFLEVAKHLLSTQKDSEVVFRALVAAGTLTTVLGKEVAQSATPAVEKAKDGAIEPRVKELASECLELLR